MKTLSLLISSSLFLLTLFYGCGSGGDETNVESSSSISSVINTSYASCTFSENDYDYCILDYPVEKCTAQNLMLVDNTPVSTIASCLDLGFSQDSAFDIDDDALYTMYAKASEISSSSVSSSESSVSDSSETQSSSDLSSSESSSASSLAPGVLKEQIISADGGIIDTGEIVLDFPVEAVSSAEEITIRKNGTHKYEILGIPKELLKPITITFPLSSMGTFDINTTFIAYEIENSCYVPSLHTYTDCFSYLPSSIEGTNLKAIIPANITPSRAPVKRTLRDQYHHAKRVSENNVTRTLSVQTTIKKVSMQNNDFNVYVNQNDFPGSNDNNLTNIAYQAGLGLVTADTKLHLMGFDTDRLVKPIPIHIRSVQDDHLLDDDTLGYTQASASSQFKPTICINKDYYQASIEFYITMGHEYFHALQYAYMKDLQAVQDAAQDDSDGAWLMEASSTWFEYEMADQPQNYQPPTTNAYNDFFIYGLYADFANKNNYFLPENSQISKRYEIGYGMALFFRYLSTREGSSIIYDIWSAFGSSNSSFKAIESALGRDKLEQEWENFILLYFAGKLPEFYPTYALWQTKPPVSYLFDAGKREPLVEDKTHFSMAKFSALNIDLNNTSNKEVKYRMRVSANNPITVLEIKTNAETTMLSVDKMLEYNLTIAANKVTKIAFINKNNIDSVTLKLDPFPDPPKVSYKFTGDEMCSMILGDEENFIPQEATLTHEKNYDIYYTSKDCGFGNNTCDPDNPSDKSTKYDGSPITLPSGLVVKAIAISPEGVPSSAIVFSEVADSLICSIQ